MNLKSAASTIAVTSICLFGIAGEVIPQTSATGNLVVDVKMTMRAKLKERFQKDRELYGVEGLRKIETAYRAYAKSKDVDNKDLQVLITEFPKANRTGCAIMYAGQRARGADDGRWFRIAIEKYGDCLYGSGAQVGAYARFYLAKHLEHKGDKEGCEKLQAEILKLYPDALTHRGGRMADFFRKGE